MEGGEGNGLLGIRFSTGQSTQKILGRKEATTVSKQRPGLVFSFDTGYDESEEARRAELARRLMAGGGAGEGGAALAAMAPQQTTMEDIRTGGVGSQPRPQFAFMHNGTEYETIGAAQKAADAVRNPPYKAKPIIGRSRGASRIRNRARILGGRSGGFG